MKLLSLLAVSALTLGCETSHGMTYHIAMDPSLSSEEVEAVLQGGEAWETAVPGLHLTYVMATCNTITDEGGNICIVSDQEAPSDSEGNMIDGHTDCDHDSALMTLHPVNMANHGHPYHNVSLNVITHELGHALAGKGSHIGLGNLMAPAISNSLIPEQITSEDVSYFWSTR